MSHDIKDAPLPADFTLNAHKLNTWLHTGDMFFLLLTIMLGATYVKVSSLDLMALHPRMNSLAFMLTAFCWAVTMLLLFRAYVYITTADRLRPFYVITTAVNLIVLVCTFLAWVDIKTDGFSLLG